MNEERARLRSHQAGLKYRRMELVTELDAAVRSVKLVLADWALREKAGVDLPGAYVHLGRAVELHRELHSLDADLRRVEEELE